MNKDQTMGNVKNFGGKVPAEVGTLVGNTEHPVTGIKLKTDDTTQKDLDEEQWSRKFDQFVRWELWA